ncbi:MAG: carbohydrate ABC transporter permease [Oscillospiraceae bacterium]|nr:carbohydrate ABC transporter permease [Oscillospiraceae bacterium]
MLRRNKVKRSAGEWVFDTCNTVFLACIAFTALYPFVFIFLYSISDPTRMMGRIGIILWPRGFQAEAYRMVFMNPMITTGYLNTLFYLFFGLLINMVMTMTAAYALSRRGVKFKRIISLFIIFTMFFSGGLIPFYLQVRAYGLLDSRLALLLPSAMSAFNLIIMRTGFETVPISLEESAKLDGATHLQICFRIIVPLSLPVIAVITLYYGVYHWNAWYHAMIFIRTRDLYPLQLILREILIANQTDNMMVESGIVAALGEAIKYATIIVATLPVLCVYPFLQRYFVKGIMIGAVKE